MAFFFGEMELVCHETLSCQVTKQVLRYAIIFYLGAVVWQKQLSRSAQIAAA
jgi:hypothetical protein